MARSAQQTEPPLPAMSPQVAATQDEASAGPEDADEARSTAAARPAPRTRSVAATGDAAAPARMAMPGRLRMTWEQRRAGKLYTVGEEVANSVSHGVGALLSIAALVLLIVVSVRHGSGVRLLAALLFGISLLLEYLFSTLYHAIQPPAAKRVLRVFDHCSIYILIAGTYTPFDLVTLAGDGGLALFFAIWGVALLGIVVETFSRERQPKWVSAVIYLAMGWAVAFRLPALISLLPAAGLWLLVAGGLSYSLGVVFYLLKRVPYMHMVWHIFVLGGSVCHFLSVVLFVL